tara:strand:+ start:2031 stop:2864 length:834 start_codon:yes stop_codon:yes gene_type:complete
MIIWLASYPKSGNTWVRMFLNSLIFTSDATVNINNIKLGQFPNRRYFQDITNNIDDVKEFIQNCNYAQSKLNLDNKIKFFKTHNAFWKIGQHHFTDDENTRGVIHIVRDPRNVITSIKNHYDHKSYEEAIKFMKDENKIIGVKGSTNEEDLPTPISSWKLHYKSWKNLVNFKSEYILIKYEDLLKDPIGQFTKITAFIEKITEIKFNEKNIHKSIQNTKFENLKKQEELEGFKEKPKNSKKFFNLGPSNDWRNLLDKNIREEIEISFKNEMLDLGYL